jgi:hypothetical protein
VTVGSDLSATVKSIATEHPSEPFLNIGSTVSLANVHNLADSPVPSAEITSYVQQTAQRHYGGVPAPPGVTGPAPSATA